VLNKVAKLRTPNLKRIPLVLFLSEVPGLQLAYLNKLNSIS
jgi:hypothetical protein